MATAAGKITTAKLTPGTEILVAHADDDKYGTLRVATKRTGSIIARVTGETASRVSRHRHITTDKGTFHALGNQTHFLATDNDRKRVEREAAKAADRSKAAEESASVLSGVTAEPAAAPEFILVEGTVTVRGETRQARQDTDGIMRFHRADNRWVKCTDAQALTFRKTEAPTLKADRGTVELSDGSLREAERMETAPGRVHVQYKLANDEWTRARGRIAASFTTQSLAERGGPALSPCKGDWQQLGCSSGLPSVHRVTTHGNTRDVCALHSPYDVSEKHPAGTEIPAPPTTNGTVKVRNNRVIARRDSDGNVTRRVSRNGGRWVRVGATVAATFQPTVLNVGSNEKEIARHKAAKAHVGDALSAPLKGFVIIGGKVRDALKHEDGTVTRATGESMGKSAAATFTLTRPTEDAESTERRIRNGKYRAPGSRPAKASGPALKWATAEAARNAGANFLALAGIYAAPGPKHNDRAFAFWHGLAERSLVVYRELGGKAAVTA
jgi:hypothetical protein